MALILSMLLCLVQVSGQNFVQVVDSPLFSVNEEAPIVSIVKSVFKALEVGTLNAED